MSTTNIKTRNLDLVLQTPEETRAQIDGMTPSEKAELSADWLTQIHSATSSDPWVHRFTLIQRACDAMIGSCGFKGPPTADGVVEIAYGIAPDYQGNGYATEAAQALVSYAFSNSKVRIVRAHTLPMPNASTRVLEKCGFKHTGEIMDSEDGLVWRWEQNKEPA